MNAIRLSVAVAVSSLLSTSALAAEHVVQPFTAAQEQAKLMQLQRGQGPQGESASSASNPTIYPQETVEFSTYWFIKTDWKVHNPNNDPVEINVHCDRYGYDNWYSIAPKADAVGKAPCEGRTLYIRNLAPEGSNLWIQATTW